MSFFPPQRGGRDGTVSAARRGAGDEGAGSDPSSDEWTDQVVPGGRDHRSEPSNHAALAAPLRGVRLRRIVRSTAEAALAEASPGGHGREGAAAVPGEVPGLQRGALSWRSCTWSDSQSFHRFARLPWHPSAFCLQENISRIQAGTWQQINRLLVQWAECQGLERGRTIRADATAVKAPSGIRSIPSCCPTRFESSPGGCAACPDITRLSFGITGAGPSGALWRSETTEASVACERIGIC